MTCKTGIGWCCAVALFATIAGGGEPPPLPPSDRVQPEIHLSGLVSADGLAFDNDGQLYISNFREVGNIGRITNHEPLPGWCVLSKIAPCDGRDPRPSGLKVDSEGSVLVADAGAGRLLRVSRDGQQADVLAERFEGLRFNSINDVAIGRQAFFFSDPGGSSEQKPVGSVYRYENSSRLVTRVATGLAYPTGLAVSPDHQFLCVAESRRFRVLIYDLAENGSVGNERVLIQFPDADKEQVRGGMYDPDGMIFDEFGRLYVCMLGGGIVNVVEVPSGKLLRQYEAGGAKVTNAHFFDNQLYLSVASQDAVFRLPLNVRGHDYRPK